MVRDVYRVGNQCRIVRELKSSVAIVWRTVTQRLCQNLVTSMHKRCVGVLQNLGVKISYQIDSVWLVVLR